MRRATCHFERRMNTVVFIIDRVATSLDCVMRRRTFHLLLSICNSPCFDSILRISIILQSLSQTVLGFRKDIFGDSVPPDLNTRWIASTRSASPMAICEILLLRLSDADKEYMRNNAVEKKLMWMILMNVCLLTTPDMHCPPRMERASEQASIQD